MKKPNILKPVHLFVLLAGCFGHATAAPFGPDGRATQWTQPDGDTVALRVFGDEYYARTENAAGYTVIRSAADNAYHYAELSADGTTLVPSATLADEPAPAGLVKHLDLPRAKIVEIIRAKRAEFDAEREERWNERVLAARQPAGKRAMSGRPS